MRTLPFLLALGCPAPDDSDVPPEDLRVTLPAMGPHGVGYRTEALSYDAGAACPGTDAGQRELRVAIWYPAPPAQPDEEFRYQGAFPAPGVLPDAPLAPGRFPLVVYSHGSRGYAEASGRLVTHLVSHGYVVVAPDHTDNTFADGDDRTTAIYWQRPHDLRVALDHARADPALAPSLSDDPVLGIGHSFGGYTLHASGGATYDPALFEDCAAGTDTSPYCSTWTPAQEACFRDGFREPRLAGVFSMAPGDWRLFEDAGLGDVEVPVFLATGGLDDVEEGDRNWSALDRPGNLRLHITDAGHNAFADFASGLDVGPEFIDAELGWSILGAYQLAWARASRGDETVAPVLDGTLVFGDTSELTVGGD